MTTQVFISYSHGDQEFVSRLVLDLRRRSAPVWVNCVDIRASALWKESITQSIRACTVFVIVVSPEFDESDWEFQLAVETKKPIIALLYCNDNIPANHEGFLDHFQHVDFRQGSYEENLNRLVVELKVNGIELAGAEVFLPGDKLERYRAWQLGTLAMVHSRAILRKTVDWALQLFLPDSLKAAKATIRLALVMMIVSPIFWTLSGTELDWQQTLSVEALMLLGVIYLKLGITHVARKRQVIEARVRESARSDPRGFFFLLRSFSRIEPYETRGGSIHLPDINIPLPSRSVLPDLEQGISDVGMLVFLQPDPISFDRKDDSWTAIRVQYSGGDWQAVFHNLADACKAIILIPGDTHGSVEEMLSIMANGLWHKTIVLMPPIVGLDGANQYHRSVGGWTDDVDEGIRMDKQEAWDNLQTQLAMWDIHLPAFDDSGCFYLPDADFSARRRVSFDPGPIERSQQIRKAFKEILSFGDFTGRPVMDIFGLLDRIECEAREAESGAPLNRDT